MLFKKRNSKEDKFEIKITGNNNTGDIKINASNQELLLSLKVLVQNMVHELHIPEYDVRESVNRALYEDEIEFNAKK